MKSKKLLFLEKILRKMAVAVLKKYRPKVVAVTGSVGKTTTKELIWTVLRGFLDARKNEKNYNNEVGVSLTIIGSESGGQSYLKWAGVFLKWLRIMLLPSKYPQVLVLEMGADRPGDIKYLTDFVPLSVGVLTSVGISHLEYFSSKKEVAKEKGQLLKSLPGKGLAVFNADCPECVEIGSRVKANVLSYGFAQEASLRASDVFYGYQNVIDSKGEKLDLLKGIGFKLNFKGKIIPIRLAHCVGVPQIYSALAALAVGTFFELNILEMAQATEDFMPVAGRMVLLEGIKNTVLIDDTYNSAPDSVTAAMDTIRGIKAKRKIVVLGDMLELGAESDAAHRAVGQQVFEAGAEVFVAVGQRMHLAALEFVRISGKADAVAEFQSPMEAGMFIQNIMKQGDLVLVKGSQGMRMEKVVEEIMFYPGLAVKLLVRQDRQWKEKEYVMP